MVGALFFKVYQIVYYRVLMHYIRAIPYNFVDSALMWIVRYLHIVRKYRIIAKCAGRCIRPVIQVKNHLNPSVRIVRYPRDSALSRCTIVCNILLVIVAA